MSDRSTASTPWRFSSRYRTAAARLLSVLLPLVSLTATAQPAGPGGINFWGQPVDGSWFDGLRWGGVLPSQGGVPDLTQTAHISHPIVVTLGQRGECHHLSIGQLGAVLRIQPDPGYPFSNFLVTHGTQLDNNGLIEIGLAGATQTSALVINNHTTAAGSGRIRLAQDTRSASLNPNNNLGWLLVNGAGHTIEGNGEINLRLQNDGIVDANVAGKELVFGGAHTVTNAGTMRARNGGSLRLSQPNGSHLFEQTGAGQVVLDAGSSMTLFGCGSSGFRGGQILGSGQLLIACQGYRMDDVEFASSLQVAFLGNSGLLVRPGGITNQALIRSGATGFIASVIGETGELRGTGRLQLEGGAMASLFGGGGQAMVNAVGHTIGGVGTIALALTNRGTVSADRNGQTSGPSELVFQTSAQANEGTILARDGGSIRLLEVSLNQTAGGQLRALDGSSVTLQGSTNPARVRGGSILTSGSGVVSASGSNDVLEDLRIEAGSRVVAPCSRTLTLRGNIDNRGRITVDNDGCGPNFATLRGDNGATITGSGELRLLANGAGTNTTLEGANGTLLLGPAQMLTGTGRINGAVRVDGVIMPDQSFAPLGPVGRISVNGSSTLSLSATTRFVVDLASASSFDAIDGNGSVDLDGTLEIDLVGGYIPALGSSFDLVTGSAVSGSFDALLLPAEFNAFDVRIEVMPDRARLHVTTPVFASGFE